MLGTLRLPSANAEGLAPRGLGTTEFALGVSLERSFARLFRAGLLAELAGRLPDTTFGVTRRFGPRASAELTLSYFATPDLVISALRQHTLGGQRQRASSANSPAPRSA